MSYTAWYKKPNGFFWHKVRNIEGDTTLETEKGVPLPVRVLFFANKTRLEIPMSYFIKFSKERFYEIQNKMEEESGQKISIKRRK